jgi:hypothetical protein
MNDNVKLNFLEYITNFTRTKAEDNQQNVTKPMPGHVSKILENDFLEFTFDLIGPYTLPKVKIPQSFSKYHREPTQVGDKGYALPNNFNLGGVSGDDGSTANSFPRGNLAPLAFHPVSNKNWDKRDPNMFLVTGGPSGHTTQSHDKTTSMVIDIVNNITHISSATITHSAAQAINHIAQSSMTHAVLNGVLNHVAHNITMGAPGATTLTDPPTPPQPTNPINVNVIGSLIASIGLSAPNISVGIGGGGSPVMTEPIPPQLRNAPQNVTGSRNNPEDAFANLLTALETLGLITDNTTP